MIPFSAIGAGITVQVLKKYRPNNYVGWLFSLLGFLLFATLDENSSMSQYIGFQVLLGVGLGIIWISTQFPILAPLPQSNNAQALAFFTWMRSFAQVC
jgi:hypothetical protein